MLIHLRGNLRILMGLLNLWSKLDFFLLFHTFHFQFILAIMLILWLFLAPLNAFHRWFLYYLCTDFTHRQCCLETSILLFVPLLYEISRLPKIELLFNPFNLLWTIMDDLKLASCAELLYFNFELLTKQKQLATQQVKT